MDQMLNLITISAAQITANRALLESTLAQHLIAVIPPAWSRMRRLVSVGQKNNTPEGYL